MAITINRSNINRDSFYDYITGCITNLKINYATPDYSDNYKVTRVPDPVFNSILGAYEKDAAKEVKEIVSKLPLQELDDLLVNIGLRLRSREDVYLRIQMAIEGIAELTDDETGEVIEDDDYVVHDGGVYTQETFDDTFFECDRCGEFHRRDESSIVHTLDGDERWCSGCTDWYAYCCDCCGEMFPGSDLTDVEDYGQVCEDCLNNSGYFYFCDNCETWHHYSDWDEDEDIPCPVCRRRTSLKWMVRGYHDRPRLVWYGKKHPKAKSIEGTGFELEVDKGSNRDSQASKFVYDNWGDQAYFNHDGSLGSGGFEIITQPMTDDYMRKIFFPQIDKVFDGLVNNYGYRSHDTSTCGLHFHFSRELFGYGANRDRALEKFTLFFEDFWDDIVKFSRRTSFDYCHRYMDDNNYYSDFKTDKDIKDLVKGKKYADRYRAINLTNRNTVEVRIMRGTLNPDTFKASYDFLYTLVKNCKRVKYSDRYNLTEWFKGLKPETIDYMKSRHAFDAYTAQLA